MTRLYQGFAERYGWTADQVNALSWPQVFEYMGDVSSGQDKHSGPQMARAVNRFKQTLAAQKKRT